MPSLSLRAVALGGALTAASALAIAHASELWGGLVPCALCLWERWPYRAVLVLGLIAAMWPRHARLLLWLMVLALLVNVGLSVIHVGVELRWWPSPLPGCSAATLPSGGSLAERLAAMPARPAKPCDDPSFLIPGLPLSMAAMNLLFALVFASLLAMSLSRRFRTR
ncbi:MAG: disulfide bond formation protein B [Acetobacteraceae bacterium]